jgi:hypothetical protein
MAPPSESQHDPDGFWFVTIVDPDLLPAWLDVQEEPGQPLLVLDYEHIFEACEVLAGAPLQRCGGLRILATSRQPLENR